MFLISWSEMTSWHHQFTIIYQNHSLEIDNKFFRFHSLRFSAWGENLPFCLGHHKTLQRHWHYRACMRVMTSLSNIAHHFSLKLHCAMRQHATDLSQMEIERSRASLAVGLLIVSYETGWLDSLNSRTLDNVMHVHKNTKPLVDFNIHWWFISALLQLFFFARISPLFGFCVQLKLSEALFIL